MANALFVLFLALLLAYVISEIFMRKGVPRVIGQILAGVILGIPIIKDNLFTTEITNAFSLITEIGILLLFFFVGLEINVRDFRRNAKESALVALFNTTIPLVCGFMASRYIFGFNNITSIIIGISVAVSSEAISLDILEELKLLRSRVGRIIITSGAVDDVFELFLISSLLILFHTSTFGQLSFSKLLWGVFTFVLIVWFAKWILIPFALRIFEKEKSQATMFMGALIIVLLMAFLSELFGVGSLIGALIAGMIVRQTLLSGAERKPWRKNEISHAIHMVAFGFLIPLFFVNVGLNTNFTNIRANLLLTVVLIIIDFSGTLLGSMIGVSLSKGSFTEGLIVGWGVLPKGDTEIVIATLALNRGLINTDIFTAIVTVALFTTFVSPIIFKRLVKKHAEITGVIVK